MLERNYDLKKKKLIENLSWAALLVVVGSFLLFRDDLPDGIWYIAIGAILVSMNLGKALFGIPLGLFTLTCGLVLFVSGLSDYLGLDVSVGPLILIVIALAIIAKSIIGYRKK